MAQDFRFLMTELWTKLKLGAPEFGPSNSVILTVDGIDVTFGESADGRHVIVSGVAGRLAPDAHRRDEQVRRLLRSNLGMMQSNKAGLSLASTDENAAVQIEAAYPYAANRIDLLTRLTEDVLFRFEMHAADLAHAQPTRQAPEPSVMASSQEAFIFRP